MKKIGGGSDLDWIAMVTEGREMRLTCWRCGDVKAIEGEGKPVTFPGWLKFYRDHKGCVDTPGGSPTPSRGGTRKKK